MVGALVLHAALIVGMGVLFVTTYTFPVMAIGGTLGPTFWPRTMALLGIGLTLVSAAQTLRAGRRTASNAETPETILAGGESDRVSGAHEPPLAMRRFWVAVAVFAMFIPALGVTGFAPAATLLAGFYVWFVGLRSRVGIAATALAVGLGFAMLFGQLLQVSLPRGLGIFRALSYTLY